jgi:hypothetical protein|tara:strand:+ start:805 stop:999 length:195 start_codon:yes stop_codon:yes gene_type:complete
MKTQKRSSSQLPDLLNHHPRNHKLTFQTYVGTFRGNKVAIVFLLISIALWSSIYMAKKAGENVG